MRLITIPDIGLEALVFQKVWFRTSRLRTTIVRHPWLSPALAPEESTGHFVSVRVGQHECNVPSP
jgi:hypothetical protein